MFVIVDIALMLFAAVLMTGAFFVIERTRGSKYIINLKIPKLVTELLIGIAYSGIFIVMQIIMKSIRSGFDVQIFLIGFVTLIMVTDYRTASFSFPIALIYYLLMNTVDAAMYANVIIFMLTAAIYLITDYLTKGIIAKMVTYGTMIVLSLVSFFLLAFPFDMGLNATTFEISMWGVILMPLFESLVSYAIRVSVSANILYESVNYDFGRFYRESLKNRAIGRVIKDRKIKQGFYGVLEVNFESQETPEQDKEVLEGVLTEIQKDFPISSVLFKVDEVGYGFFLPTNFKNKLNLSIKNNSAPKRDELDPVYNLEKILTVASKQFRTSFGKSVDVELFAGIAIYGIQESSIDQLDSNAKFALKINELNPNNRVSLFDPLMYRNKVNDSHDLQALDKAIGLDDYASRFVPIFDLKTEDTAFNYVVQINTSETEFIDEVRNFISSTGMINVFERYFAVDAISKSKDYKGDLIIDYSIDILNEDFNTAEFMRLLRDKGFKPERLILSSYTDDIQDHSDLSVIREKIKELKAGGIRFAVRGYEPARIKADFRLISASHLDMMKSSYPEQVIAFDIDLEEKAALAINKNINFIGGPLFERNVIPNNFNKQSKIYIEDIESRKR